MEFEFELELELEFEPERATRLWPTSACKTISTNSQSYFLLVRVAKPNTEKSAPGWRATPTGRASAMLRRHPSTKANFSMVTVEKKHTQPHNERTEDLSNPDPRGSAGPYLPESVGPGLRWSGWRDVLKIRSDCWTLYRQTSRWSSYWQVARL